MNITSMSRFRIANVVYVWRTWVNYRVIADPDSNVSLSSLIAPNRRDILLLAGVDEPIHIG